MRIHLIQMKYFLSLEKALIFKINLLISKNKTPSSRYDEYISSYEKYNGAYGLDDQTIDSAFEGDPSNYWNIE